MEQGPTGMDVQRTVDQLTRVLAAFGAASVAVGSVMAMAAKDEAVRSFGVQSAGWGAVNLGIAAVGAVRNGSRPVDAGRLRTVLLLNAAADVAYVAAGAHVAHHGVPVGRVTPAAARGAGLAVVAQGLGLLAVDVGFARRLRP